MRKTGAPEQEVSALEQQKNIERHKRNRVTHLRIRDYLVSLRSPSACFKEEIYYKSPSFVQHLTCVRSVQSINKLRMHTKWEAMFHHHV